jgi:hypothetical protein
VAGLAADGSSEPWIRIFEGGGADTGGRLAFDTSNRVRLAAEALDGHFAFAGASLPAGAPSGKDIAVATCTTATCSSATVTVFGGPLDDGVSAIAADPLLGGAIFLTGYYRGSWSGLPDTGTAPAILVMKVDGSGSAVWSRGFPQTTGAVCTNTGLHQAKGYALAATPAGDVVVTGAMCGETDFGSDPFDAKIVLPGKGGPDVFVAKLSGATGKVLWARSFGDAAEQFGTGVAVGKDGALYVTGTFAGTLDLGSGHLHSSPAGSQSIFLAALSAASASPLRSAAFGAGEPIDFRPIAAAADATSVVIGGTWKSSLAFGDGAVLDPEGDLDAFVARFTQ